MAMSEPPTGKGSVQLLWRLSSVAAIWLLLVYLGLVLPVDRLLPFMNRWFGAVALLVASLVLTHYALDRWLWRGPDAAEKTRNALLLAVVTLVCALFGDIGFTAFANVNPSHSFDPRKLYSEGRDRDVHMWDSESLPYTYHPTQENFYLHKPGQTKVSTIFGEHYYPALYSHKILRESVLKARNVAFVIDKYGLRNTDDPATAKIFALGDSFCLGYHMTQEATFITRMKALLGEPVYNMGASGTSPMQQYLLLQYMLRTYPDAFKPRQLLWLLFEGNDLEENYDLLLPSPVSRLRSAFEGTVVGVVANMPALIRHESIIRLVTGGDVELTSEVGPRTKFNHYKVDGQSIGVPLYHSARFGYRLFRQTYIDRATQPESYVRNHPNQPALVDTFRRMKALAAEHGFEVTVVTVPTAPRLYKADFEDLPPITKEPHFINYLKRLADENGFRRLDLYELLTPYAEKELIYNRDDTHWNERGHEIVAQLLAERVKLGAAKRTGP
jgi:SGNH hydrolase-like domain, acetyltransferase AlgX